MMIVWLGMTLWIALAFVAMGINRRLDRIATALESKGNQS